MIPPATRSILERFLDVPATAGNVFHGVMVVSGVFEDKGSLGNNAEWTIACANEDA